MQTLTKDMLNSKGEIKSYFNRKSIKFLMQLALLIAILYCCIDNGIINELRNALDILGIKDTNRFILELGLPIKSLFESVQFVNFLFLVFKLLMGMIILPIVFIFFVKIVKRVRESSSTKPTNSTKYIPADLGAVYIINSKFLC